MILRSEQSDIGRRLDEFVSEKAGWPRGKGNKAVKDGLVKVNGSVIAKPSFSLKGNEDIDVTRPEEPLTDLIPEDIPLNVVYEDDDILVINKPQGLVVHPGNGVPSGTIANALAYRYKNLAGDPLRPGIVHRIDKDTSGLLAIAKTPLAMEGLGSQLSDHSMHREYIALVYGRIGEEEAKIDAPIARDNRNPMKYRVVGEGGKEAITYLKVIERFRDYTLIRCRLLTGRTHQIRVHLEYIGHPVIGDPLYGAGNRKLYDKGQLLHAAKLVLKHPKTGEEMAFEAPLPDYFEEIIGALRSERS